MANTIEQFKSNMAWTTLTLNATQQESIFESVDRESYADMEALEEDYNYDDNLISIDVNLHSVLENFSELIERGKLNSITLYYLKEDEMYAGVLTYDY